MTGAPVASLVLRLAILSLCLIPFSSRADQLPAPPTPQERVCAEMFDAIFSVMRQNRDYFYQMGVTDRDELARKIIAFGSTQAIIGVFRRNCPVDAKFVPSEAILAMAYHIIAERFGNPPSN